MVLRWGICGAGLISSDFVSSVLAPPSNVHEVVCIGARSMEKAQKFADKFGIKKAYGSYEEVGNDPDVGKLECSEVSFADSQALYHIIDEVVKQYGRNVKW